MSGHVVCFGEVLLRLATQRHRMMVQSDSLDMIVGGAEANLAAGLASLGHAVKLVSRVTANPLGDKALAALAGAGVDIAQVGRAPGRVGLYFFESGAGLRPSAITYDRADSTFAVSSPDDFDFAAALSGARLLHVSGITPALGPNGVALARAAVEAAAGASVPICFDGNYRALLWESWASDPRGVLCELVSRATILIGNHRDISLLLGQTFSGDGRREAAEAAFAAFPRLELIASTARHMVDAAHHRLAARVDGREGGYQTADLDVIGIVDRIGAGDAFAAGLLHRWLQGADLAAMAEAGLAYTALKHSLPGDMCLIGAEELDSFSASGGDVRR